MDVIGRPVLLLTAVSGFPFSFSPEGADRYDPIKVPEN
jgi:hypothetical protein